MSSPLIFNYRRRSHSASSPSPSPVPKPLWRPASKRARSSHCNSPAITDSPSSQSRNVDFWRTGKRLRRDVSPSSMTYATGSSTPASTDSRSSGLSSSAPHTPLFATTPADFLLFPSCESHRETTSNKSRNKSTNPFDFRVVQSDFSDPDATRLRSDAFWELHRSIAENGEGLVKRMRDFEDSRSKSGIYNRARALQRRRAKQRHTPSVPVTRSIRRSSSSESHEEDVQIYSGELSGLPISRQKRASSLGLMDTENNEMRGASTSSLSECADHVSVHTSISNNDTDDLSRHSFNTTFPSDALHSTSSSPAYKYSAYTTASSSSSGPSINSSFNALFPSSTDRNSIFWASSSHSTPSTQETPSLTSSASRTEKAIAALSLAIANGAGGLDDYEAARDLDSSPAMADSQAGELWH
ncbi:hypothetical protein K503DRAFT_764656 [Rhizopogon vinicolor AM-OR11-026]|uniref:Uncharacterized protein n=1 Tax=Rhizopogon vinicolor AM-OR11-026 TaxID=1314800 RepID=A0A1B7NIX5_9AGAM|nr:hypothetical protein K503DRAFT_764656 [Rhizopogon vinicolor AM-OR11-026]